MSESTLLFFQNHSNRLLDLFFTVITFTAEEYFLIAVITFVFWNISKRAGFIISLLYLTTMVVNSVLKLGFHTARPWDVINGLQAKREHTATGYSFPSGHTQGGTTFFLTCALLFRKWWALAAASGLSILIAVSRLYLGVHWPIDVVFGLLLAFLFTIPLYYLVTYAKYREFVLKTVAVTVAVYSILATVVLQIMMAAGVDLVQDQVGLFKVSGIVSGCVAGYFIQERFAPFEPGTGTIIQKVIRYLVGIITSGILLIGLKLVFPGWAVFSWLRYTVVGIWITGGWPLVGMKVGLFSTGKDRLRMELQNV